MTIEFSGEVWYWRGPAPFYFITVPPYESRQIKELESIVTYGWGMIPVTARIGSTEWTTSLWPKDGNYVLPLKTVVRRAQQIDEGDMVTAIMEIEATPPKD